MNNEREHQEVCDACGKPFTEKEWDVRHTRHEEGCPYEDEAADGWNWCDCDINYHTECCPDCNGPMGYFQVHL